MNKLFLFVPRPPRNAGPGAHSRAPRHLHAERLAPVWPPAASRRRRAGDGRTSDHVSPVDGRARGAPDRPRPFRETGVVYSGGGRRKDRNPGRCPRRSGAIAPIASVLVAAAIVSATVVPAPRAEEHPVELRQYRHQGCMLFAKERYLPYYAQHGFPQTFNERPDDAHDFVPRSLSDERGFETARTSLSPLGFPPPGSTMRWGSALPAPIS